MRLLLLSTTTGYQAQAFAEAARSLGMQVAFGNDRCERMDDPWHDAALSLHFEDPERSARVILEYARNNPLSAVVSVGDHPTITAAVVCRELKLPGHTVAAAEACHNKYIARQILGKAGLLVPEFSCHAISDGPHAALLKASFPSVLKPVALSGSRGVIRANTPREFVSAFRRIAALLTSAELQVKKAGTIPQILIEDYIPGAEFAVEALMSKGELRVLALFDKPDPLEGPYFEETIYVTPSRLPAADQAAITAALKKAVQALGLYHGPVHAEFRLNDAGPWILELAARPIGGLCSRALRFDRDMSLEELIVRNAAGENLCSISREECASGVMMIPVPDAGVFERVDGEQDALAVPGIEEVRITAKLGQKLRPWPEGASYPGFLFARAPSPEDVDQALREAHRRLKFVMSPALAVV